jgi:hypothetical protein
LGQRELVAFSDGAFAALGMLLAMACEHSHDRLRESFLLLEKPVSAAVARARFTSGCSLG